MAGRPRPLIGLVAGAAAGVAATALLTALDRDKRAKPGKPASPLAPYVIGATIGGLYGVLAEYQEDAGNGFGAAYGLAAGALLEDAAPAASDQPTIAATAPPLLYGAVLLGLRALLAGRAKEEATP